MKLRSRSPKATIAGTAGSAIGGIWKAYALFATASQLPTDASRLGFFLANPPTWLPWGILAFSVLVLAWSLWPTDEEDEGGFKTGQITHGPQSPSIGTVHGDVHFTAPPVVPEHLPPLTSAFAIGEAVIRSSPVVTEAGDMVPDLYCVGMFLRIGNAQTNARTLRDVSAKINWPFGGPLPLAFEEGNTRVDIRSGESFLPQVGYTMSSYFVGFPFIPNRNVVMEAAQAADEESKLARDVATLFAGLPSPETLSFEWPHENAEGIPFRLILHADDVLSVVVPILVNVSWAGKAMPQLMLQPNVAAR